MGLFSKFDTKYKLNKSGLTLAKYPAGGYALLQNGKIIEDNIKGVSRNVFFCQKNDNKDVFFIVTSDMKYKVYSLCDGVELLSSLEPGNHDGIQILKEGDEIIVDAGEGLGKWLINTRGHAVSEDYLEIGEKDANSNRKVKKMYAGLACSYYVDERANKISPDFIDEKDAGDKFKILRIVGDGGQYEDVVWAVNGEYISSGFEKIDYVSGRFIVEDNGQTFFIDHRGERMTGNVSSYKILNNGLLIAKDNSKTYSTVYNDMYGAIAVIKKPIVDKNAGVIVGDNVNGKTIMMGYDSRKVYEVDGAMARLILSKTMGRTSSAQYAEEVLNKNHDIRNTVKIYEAIIEDNLKREPKNRDLIWLSKNAKNLCLYEINNALTRMQERDAALQQEGNEGTKLDIFFKPNIVKSWQEDLKKKHSESEEKQ